MHTNLPFNQERRKEYGWDTNTKTRPTLLSDFREAVATGAVSIKSKEAYEEMQTFVQGERPEAAPGQHDDRIFAHAIAWQVRKLVPRMMNRGGMVTTGWSG